MPACHHYSSEPCSQSCPLCTSESIPKYRTQPNIQMIRIQIVWLCIYASSLINMLTALQMWNTERDALLITGSTILCLCTVYTAV